MNRATLKIDAGITDDITRRCIPIRRVGENEDGNHVMKVMDSSDKGDNIKSVVLKDGSLELLTNDMKSREYEIDALKWWNDDFEYQIFGRSDDLIEVRGFNADEMYCDINGTVLEIGETLVKIYVNGRGNWSFDILSEGRENLEIKHSNTDASKMFCEYSELLCVSDVKQIENPEKV